MRYIYRFGSAPSSVRDFSSEDFTASALDVPSRSDHWRRPRRSVVDAVREGRRRLQLVVYNYKIFSFGFSPPIGQITFSFSFFFFRFFIHSPLLRINYSICSLEPIKQKLVR
ncbi:hypothetical protein CMV_010490 [Castanea mollissima]|uniref:Uncharacterized protein n=1 Tax=Castanea mollissima TaxID=60419 RepID=A0A8J4RJ58_9ROSI|nr:hypothetical protein CMV_010490 [Castanea mollissima]